MQNENENDAIDITGRGLTSFEKRAFIAKVTGQSAIDKGARRMRRRDANHYGILSLALLYSVPRAEIVADGLALENASKRQARARAQAISNNRKAHADAMRSIGLVSYRNGRGQTCWE